MRSTAFLLAGLVLVSGCGLFALACSSEDESPAAHDGGTREEEFPSCQDILTQCYELDQGIGPIHECHQYALSEDATEATCAEKKKECAKICVPTFDSGNPDELPPDGDAGTATDAPADG